MIPGEKRLDRLLRRHPAEVGLEFVWNPHLEKVGLFKKEETSSIGFIRNLSLEGALVEVPVDQDHEPGDTVLIRFRDTDGRAEIRHRSAGPDGHFLYGVKFVRQPEFNAAIEKAVGELRGNAEKLDIAWKRQN
jgi:PilZ domain-containing protein